MDLRAFMVSQAAILESAVYEARFEAIQYPLLAPVTTEGGEWAPTIERRTMTGQGQAKRLAHLADDWPDVESQYSRLSINVGTFGASYSVAEDDAWVAQQGGFNLATDKARTARRIVEEKLDELFRNGDSDLGSDKFELASITSKAATKKWTDASLTADNITTIAKEVNDGIGAVYSETKGIHLPNTLAIPRDRFTALASVQIPNTTMTLLEWIRQNNAYTAQTGTPLTIVGTGALAGGTSGNAVIYERNEDVLRFHMVVPINVRGPMLSNFGMTMGFGVYARSAGLEWRIPKAAYRLTGI